MSNDTRYNGWTNYETWNLALWLGNEQSSSEYWAERADDAYRHARETVNPRFTREENARLALAHELQADIEENTPTVTGFYADVLNAAISEVNWYEIAHHYIDDVEKDTEEETA